MTRLGMLAAFGIVACVGGCDGSGGDAGNAPNGNASAGAGGVGAGGVGTGGIAASTAGTSNGVSLGGGFAVAATASLGSSVLATGGSVATAGSTASTGGSVATSVGGSIALGGSVAIAGATGVQHVGGSAGANGVGGTGACNYPICLFNLFSACPAAPPTTTCIMQDTTSATQRQTNACYGDGSSASSVVDLTTFASTMTLKRDGATCYTMEATVTMSNLVPTSTSMTIKNGSGTLVATEVWDVASNTTTVTCAGEQPVILNAACDTSSSGTYDCQPGVCNP